MKVYALNASPRKGWNCDQLLDRFIEGVKDTDPKIEVEKVHLYDLDYLGCRSCLKLSLSKLTFPVVQSTKLSISA